MTYVMIDWDWPDIPGIPGFPDIPSPGDVLEAMLGALAEAMKADGVKALNLIAKDLDVLSSDVFTSLWLKLLVAAVFGMAIVFTGFVSTIFVIIESLSRRIDAVTRMMMAGQHFFKMIIACYMALPIFGIGTYLSQMLTESTGKILTYNNPSTGYDSLFEIDSPTSLFAALFLNAMIMAAGGALHWELSNFQYALIPMVLWFPLAYSIKQLGIWGERGWKLYVSFVSACMFSVPVVVFFLGIAAQVIANVPGLQPMEQNFFLLGTVAMCALVPLLVLILSYVAYTIQINKSKAEVEGKVEIMPESVQNFLYGQQIAERVRQATTQSESWTTDMSHASAPKERIARDYMRAEGNAAIKSKVDARIDLVTTAAATKATAGVGAAAGPIAGIAAGVVVKAGGEAVKTRAHKKIDDRIPPGNRLP